MIITIEDAPNIKHISIDINFEDDSECSPVVKINKNISNTPKPTEHKHSMMDDLDLDLDENFEVDEEVVEIPVIPDQSREVNVSDDMANLSI